MNQEEKQEQEVTTTLKTLSTRIDELCNLIKENNEKTQRRIKQEIEELSKKMKIQKESAEEKIKQEPLKYVIGAFIGGLLAGLLISKRNK